VSVKKTTAQMTITLTNMTSVAKSVWLSSSISRLANRTPRRRRATDRVQPSRGLAVLDGAAMRAPQVEMDACGPNWSDPPAHWRGQIIGSRVKSAADAITIKQAKMISPTPRA
jgi:hypothetical protein